MSGEIDPYFKALFFTRVRELGLAKGFHRRSEVLPVLVSQILGVARDFSAEGLIDPEEMAAALFSELLADGVFEEEAPRFAGKYYSLSVANYNQFRVKVISGSEIVATAERIGNRFYVDVFDGYRAHLAEFETDQIGVPASDRLVFLGDNEPVLEKIRSDVGALQNLLVSSNDLGDLTKEEAAVASNEIAQLGEMLRKPSVRLSTMSSYATRTLRWIAEKAAGAAVGKAAWALLVLIATFFGFIN